MKLFTDLLSTPYGLMSLGSIVVTIPMGIWYGMNFNRKMKEDAKKAGL